MTAPLVLAHRGASGYLPDHTLEAYALAIAQGADFIEPDLVATKDGVLVARHENELSRTTDVAERFPDRRTVKTIDGQRVEGWFSEDLTLAELKTLRARQPLPDRPHDHDGRYVVPTFDEICAFVASKEKELGRRIGVVPETKHPSYFDALGLSLEEPLVRTLAAYGYDGPEDPLIVQSFETANLVELRRMTGVRLLRLVDDERELLTADGLRTIRTFADAVGLPKQALIGADGKPTTVVADAHAAGLEVHVYTFRNEPASVSAWANGDPIAELKRFYALGVDAVFADFPDTAVKAR
jgi:glycerophosphoryl diester phosphodiesterase